MSELYVVSESVLAQAPPSGDLWPIVLVHADGHAGAASVVNRGTDQTVAFTLKGNVGISNANPKFGDGALLFSSAADVVEATQTTSSQGINLDTVDFTLECWIYPIAVSGTQTIVARWQSQSYMLQMVSGVLRFNWAPFSTTLPLLTSTGPLISANQWTHIAVTRLGGTWTLWQNGVRVALAFNSAIPTANTGVVTTIGGHYVTAGSVVAPFGGYIDEIRIVKGQAVYQGDSYTVPTQAFTAPYTNSVASATVEIVSEMAKPPEKRSMYMVAESALLVPPSGEYAKRVNMEIVGSGSPALLPSAKVHQLRLSVLAPDPKPGSMKSASLEFVASSVEAVEPPALYAVSETVLIQNRADGAQMRQASLEILGAADSNADTPRSMYAVSEMVLLSNTQGPPVSQAKVEISAYANYDWRPVVKARTVQVSVLTVEPKTTKASKVALEVVATDPNAVRDRSLLMVNELVLLGEVSNRVSKASLEVVSDSGVAPPANVQQVVWFTTQ